jgi:23S rRNA (guanosine2251-2'-O)-methyltransferase
VTEAVAVLEGLISVEAALQARSREIHALYIRRDLREPGVLRLAKLAAAAGITAERVPEEVIAAHVEGKTHGGIVALVGERRFVSLDALIEGRDRPFVVMLDGVEDPFNFGQAVRAFYAAGADGLVVRPRNWMSAAAVVARSSAGASELIPTAVAETAQEAADFYRAGGLTIAVTDKDRAVSIYEADLTVPLFLVIGGEKRGVTRSFADAADMRLKIPYGREFKQSLGTTPAAAALAFEVMRQRREVESGK